MAKIKMLHTVDGSPDGRIVHRHHEGNTYDLPPALSDVYLEEGWGEPDESARELSVGAKPDTFRPPAKTKAERAAEAIVAAQEGIPGAAKAHADLKAELTAAKIEAEQAKAEAADLKAKLEDEKAKKAGK